MTTGFLTRDDTRIHFESAGHGPAVLFLHAGVCDSRMWRDQIGLDGYQTIAFDQRGFGRTRWVPGPYSNRGDALALLDHLDVERAVVVGCSNGGEAAMQVALVAPQRVRGLVLVGAAPRGWAPEGGWATDHLENEALAASTAGDHERVVELDTQMWLSGPGRSIEDVDPDLIALFQEMDRSPVRTETERIECMQSLEPPTNEQLGDITAPTLVIVGEHDYPDLITAARYLAERLSDRDAVVLESTAHLPPLEVPERFNSALTGFLQSLPF